VSWFWRVVLLLHLFSILLVYLAFIQSDYLEFWGLRQAWRGLVGLWTGHGAETIPLFGTHRLVTTGLYGWIRHPMLSGGLLFLLTSGPSQNNLLFLGMYLSYMLVGGWYEEKRLVRIFGEEYRQYQRRVGAFVPRLRSAGGGNGPSAAPTGSKMG
jgi:protein-S-isoprenylcysteine O-methyltransferase Ste14